VRTTDNNGGKPLDEITEKNEKYSIDDLKKIAGKKIEDIKPDKYPNLLVFPNKWNVYHDDIHNQEIFSLSDENIIKTKNIMGFIGLNDTNLTITSRFAKDDTNDYFLHYMLKKVMAVNIVNLEHSGDKNDIWNFLLFLFPYFLNKAVSQGLYKEYIRNEYNNINVKGAIDVKKHLRINIPFSGKIAYSTREYNYDNPVMQIIRHTIEYIKNSKYNNVLTNNNDTFSNVNNIILSTQKYKKNDRQKIININQKKVVVHPYFTEYKTLQRLCIRILTNEKISAKNEKEKIHGILFDGAWLWEEYLNTVLKKADFKHPLNKKGEGGFCLFSDRTGRIYPDFYKTSPPIIADAKYKHMEYYFKTRAEDNENKRRNNSDYYQLISYMYRFKSKKGCFIFPYSGDLLFKEEKIMLKGFDNQSLNDKIVFLGMKIPRNDSFNDFCNDMEKSENELLNEVTAE